MIKQDEKICSFFQLEKPSLIGVGVFGRVYKAEDRKAGKFRCIKIIPIDKFKKEEYDVSERLKDKNNENLIIYSQIEVFEDMKLVALVMDYINGGDLKSYTDNYVGYFSPKEIFNLIKQNFIYVIILI
jgi:serine/threonine protein kinase